MFNVHSINHENSHLKHRCRLHTYSSHSCLHNSYLRVSDRTYTFLYRSRFPLINEDWNANRLRFSSCQTCCELPTGADCILSSDDRVELRNFFTFQYGKSDKVISSRECEMLINRFQIL